MSMHILDELPVPQPPYRMKRPMAVLAMAEEPAIASTEGEALLPVPEAPLPSPEAVASSPAEVAAERSAAIESATQAARAQLDQPALTDATPEESGQDDANRQSALGQIDSAATEANAKTAALKESLVRMASETRTPEQQAEDKVLAQKLREERDQSRAAEAPAPEPAPASPQEAKVPVSQMKKLEGESEGEFRQRKYVEKTSAKQKEEKTRNQDAAKAEDAARDDKKMETPEGLEFKQPQETAAQKAGRIGREALEKLNDFKNAQEKSESAKVQPKDKPSLEEVEFLKQRADLAQKQAEAAKRGEAIPEDKVDMAKVEAAGAQPKPEGNPDQARWTAEWTQEIKDAESFEDLYAKMRDAGEYLVSPSTGKPVDIEREIAIIENYRTTGNQFMRVEGGGAQPTRGMGVREKVIALRAKEQAPATEAAPEPAAEAPKAPETAGPTGLEDAFDAEGNLKLVPLEETPAATEVPAEVGSKRVNFKAGTPERDRIAEVVREADAVVAERSRKAAEAAPAAPAERAPTAREQAQEKIIAQLQQRLAQFETQQPQPAASAEGAPPTPERATRVGEIGEQQGLSFWEKFTAERAAGAEDWKAAIAAILAKKWEGRLERRNEKIKKWEESGEKAAKKGALGMTKSWLWDESWANYHRWRGREAYKSQEAWNDARVRRENSRDEALNQGAAKIDRLLDSQLERIDQFAFQRDEQEDGLKKLHAKHQEYTELLALAATPDERSQVRGILDTIEENLKETAEKKRGTEEKWQAERKRAAKEQARKEQLLSYAVRPARIDTTPKKKEYDWLVQRITRPGGSPKPRAGKIPTPGVAA